MDRMDCNNEKFHKVNQTADFPHTSQIVVDTPFIHPYYSTKLAPFAATTTRRCQHRIIRPNDLLRKMMR